MHWTGKITLSVVLLFNLFAASPVLAEVLYPYPSIGDGKAGIEVPLTLVDGVTAC